MGDSKIPFKTNTDQFKTGQFRRKSRLSGYLSGKRKPLKTTKVDLAEEKENRVIWMLKWVLLLPLGIYALVWLLVVVIDLFSS